MDLSSKMKLLEEVKGETLGRQLDCAKGRKEKPVFWYRNRAIKDTKGTTRCVWKINRQFLCNKALSKKMGKEQRGKKNGVVTFVKHEKVWAFSCGCGNCQERWCHYSSILAVSRFRG